MSLQEIKDHERSLKHRGLSVSKEFNLKSKQIEEEETLKEERKK